MVVYITSEANMKNLEANRAEHAASLPIRGGCPRRGAADHRCHQAALSHQRRAAQRRDEPVGGCHGTRLSARGQRRALHPADSRQRDRQRSPTHRHRRARSLCRLVLRLQDRRAIRRRRELRRAALLGQVRLPRQQPRHQLRRRHAAHPPQVVSEVGAADLARPSRSADAALHLQRPAAAEREPGSDSLQRAAVLCDLRSEQADRLRHARACGTSGSWTRGHRAISASPRQPQRHAADVRDLQPGRRQHEEGRPVRARRRSASGTARIRHRPATSTGRSAIRSTTRRPASSPRSN